MELNNVLIFCFLSRRIEEYRKKVILQLPEKPVLYPYFMPSHVPLTGRLDANIFLDAFSTPECFPADTSSDASSDDMCEEIEENFSETENRRRKGGLGTDTETLGFVVMDPSDLDCFVNKYEEKMIGRPNNMIFFVTGVNDKKSGGVNIALARLLARALKFSRGFIVDDDIKNMMEFMKHTFEWKQCSILRGMIYLQKCFSAQSVESRCMEDIIEMWESGDDDRRDDFDEHIADIFDKCIGHVTASVRDCDRLKGQFMRRFQRKMNILVNSPSELRVILEDTFSSFPDCIPYVDDIVSAFRGKFLSDSEYKISDIAVMNQNSRQGNLHLKENSYLNWSSTRYQFNI